MLKKILVGALAAASMATAAASPVGFSVNQSITQIISPDSNAEFVKFDVSVPGGFTFTLDPGEGETFLELTITNGHFGVQNDGWSLQRFGSGDVIDGTTLKNLNAADPWSYPLYDGMLGDGWGESLDKTWIGFAATKSGHTYYGFIEANWEVNWNPDGETGTAKLTLGNGAIESDAGASITVQDVTVQDATVPEPATLSLLGLGLLGAGLVRSRRRV